jgi:hypothetical protein
MKKSDNQPSCKGKHSSCSPVHHPFRSRLPGSRRHPPVPGAKIKRSQNTKESATSPATGATSRAPAGADPDFSMHPFCCAPLVPVSPAASAAPAASSAVAGTQAVMPPPQPPPLPPPPPRNNSATGGERRARAAGVSGGGGGDSSPLEGVKLNEIVGGGISGIMYKWVNYGRGWRPRWFALHEGVLSFYKIHGPDRIILSRETERGAKVIGEESLRRLNRPSAFSPSHSNGHHHPRNPIGEIHLKVLGSGPVPPS